MDTMNTKDQDINTSFVLNKLLHCVVMLWIIETHEQLNYYIFEHNSDCMTGGPWYNTSICKRYTEICFE